MLGRSRRYLPLIVFLLGCYGGFLVGQGTNHQRIADAPCPSLAAHPQVHRRTAGTLSIESYESALVRVEELLRQRYTSYLKHVKPAPIRVSKEHFEQAWKAHTDACPKTPRVALCSPLKDEGAGNISRGSSFLTLMICSVECARMDHVESLHWHCSSLPL